MTKRATHESRELHQHFVAVQMTELVIFHLEVIDIKQRQAVLLRSHIRLRTPVPMTGAEDQMLDAFVERLTVMQAGQSVQFVARQQVQLVAENLEKSREHLVSPPTARMPSITSIAVT
jgi:hypothetical protein